MKLYTVCFSGLWSAHCSLVIKAANINDAFGLAKSTITHTSIEIEDVSEIKIKRGPQVIEYLRGG